MYGFSLHLAAGKRAEIIEELSERLHELAKIAFVEALVGGMSVAAGSSMPSSRAGAPPNSSDKRPHKANRAAASDGHGLFAERALHG